MYYNKQTPALQTNNFSDTTLILILFLDAVKEKLTLKHKVRV